jgi:hypothetical protein
MVDVCKFNEAYIIDWIHKKLGGPAVCVELEETQLKHIIDDVMELFQEYRPKELYIGGQYQRGYHYITAPDEAIGVLDVEFVRQDYQSYESIEGALLYDPFYFLSAGGISGIDVQTYDLVRHWVEIISREFGSEEGYILLDDGNLFLQVPGTFSVTIKWAMPWVGLCDLHRPYQQIFLKLALAKAMVVLGNIRGKFSQGVPGAGGMVSLDADYLRQTGEAEEKAYIDELKRISPHFIPSLG